MTEEDRARTALRRLAALPEAAPAPGGPARLLAPEGSDGAAMRRAVVAEVEGAVLPVALELLALPEGGGLALALGGRRLRGPGGAGEAAARLAGFLAEAAARGAGLAARTAAAGGPGGPEIGGEIGGEGLPAPRLDERLAALMPKDGAPPPAGEGPAAEGPGGEGPGEVLGEEEDLEALLARLAAPPGALPLPEGGAGALGDVPPARALAEAAEGLLAARGPGPWAVCRGPAPGAGPGAGPGAMAAALVAWPDAPPRLLALRAADLPALLAGLGRLLPQDG
ncbi:hypothetical protein BCF33_2805 [Hasllibacter halocynthiae]|uniref:Uncharacterized protein n=1 Tax=Hasllibacter halocynthiae TaxID=595589 RepID=A0A2T0WYZ4_9RHOB|nr:hypothetical protein [Hasllibacter halocynthiae]PRY91923.1 hypothetical protein BCF33_2805 [Hasllibacter halocynthiae]